MGKQGYVILNTSVLKYPFKEQHYNYNFIKMRKNAIISPGFRKMTDKIKWLIRT